MTPSGVPLKSLAAGVVWEQVGSGVELAAGRQVFVYARGTAAPVGVFSDQGLTIPIPGGQPLVVGSDGGVPGFVAAEVAIDFFDVASGKRGQAEPLAVGDLIGSDGRVGGAGSLGLPLSVGNVISGIAFAGAPSGGDDTATLAALMVSNATVFLRQGAKYQCQLSLNGVNNLTVIGNGATLHNVTAAVDAFEAVNCNDLNLWDFYAQGIAGTRDGVHLEFCQRARVRISSGGSGRAMLWAQKCVAIKLDCHLSVNVGPFGGLAASAQGGAVLTWDGTDVTSGCNEAVIEGGVYVVGQTPQSSTNTAQFAPGWAIQFIRCEGATVAGPVTELSAGGIYAQFCTNLVLVNDYCELNPSDVEYSTGTVSVTNGSTAVVGTGTTFNNAPTAPEQANGFPGKYLVGPIGAGMAFAKVATLTDATRLTLAAQNELLAAGWRGATNATLAYRLVSFDVFLDNCTDCNVVWSRGGGAIALRSTARCSIHALTDSVLEDAGCALNQINVSSNRANNGASRVVSLGVSSRVREINYQTGTLVSDPAMYVPGAAAIGNYGAIGTVRQPSLTRPVLCVLSCGSGASGGVTQTIEALCDAANPPTTIVGYFSSSTANEISTITFIVPPGFNYKIVQTAGTTGGLFALAEYAL